MPDPRTGAAIPRRQGRLATGLAFGLAAYALYWVVGIVPAQIYRPSFLLIALVVLPLTWWFNRREVDL